MDTTRDYDAAKALTVSSFRQFIDTTDQLTYLSLSVQEQNVLIEEIAKVVPAGNVPSLVTAGLANLPDRVVSVDDSRRNISLLIQGMQVFLDQAVFKTFFEGPARLLDAYQKMLKLAGKDLSRSFPEGTWQFYLEFGLREDSSRHSCETIGFQRALRQQSLELALSDQLAAWVVASAWLLGQYKSLLDNEWHEHVYLQYLAQLLKDTGRPTDQLERWLKVRPYSVPENQPNIDFVEYRRQIFQAFCREELAKLDPNLRRKIERTWNNPRSVEQRAEELTAYQRQMSILATLNPSDHSDMRVPLPPQNLHIAVIAAGRYYLINFEQARSWETIRPVCAAILRRGNNENSPATLDQILCTARRREQVALRRLLPADAKADLELLRSAPIILNWDVSRSEQPLADIRNNRRGIGDHALTIFRGSNSMIFDLSHIFFDGPWGMVVAEILTNQATRLAHQLSAAPSISAEVSQVKTVALQMPEDIEKRARKVQLPPEVSGETIFANLPLLQEVRRNLKLRNPELLLTVNDLLLMFRSIFGPLYHPSTKLMYELAMLKDNSAKRLQQSAQLALSALESAQQPNPALLIPIDATKINPRERVYPLTFRNPFGNLLEQHLQAWNALQALKGTRAFNTRAGSEARATGKAYLMTISAFGQVLSKYKEVALSGESASTVTIKLLAGLPPALQKLLTSYPERFDVINDTIKGQEVFSNVGQVSLQSSLTRFNTAKDDNEKKTLAWGILTDAQGRLHISLRDFRPHVAALVNLHHEELAQRITQEFVDAYALSLNTYLEELLLIIRAKPKLDRT